MRQKKTDYSELYVPADTFFEINNLDPDRKTIVLSLPKPPKLELIDGFSLHPDEQYFRRFKTPAKLLSIERDVLRELQDIQKSNRQETVTGYKIIDKFWDKVEEERDDLENEIDFIRKIWYFRFNGYWFFNDGKPTYITGRHFMFLNFFYQPDIKENDGYPEYRDRHRREFLFREYLRHTTETFAKRDERGWAISNDDGSYDIVDVGSKVSYGDIEPKNRRNGSTMMGLSDMIEDSERAFGVYSTIISKDGDSTEEAYNLKLLPAWVNRPYFIKPVWQGSSQPTQIKYFPPKNYYTSEALMSIIDYTVSAGETKKDGSKFNGFLLMDEEGKTLTSNVLQRWDINKNALALGDGTKILGYSSHVTTVEDINAAGMAFLDMLELSDFYQRGDNGQTISGLMAHLYPAYDGLEGFIDRFGYSVIDSPTDRQKRLSPTAIFTTLNKGAKQYQQEKRDDFLKQGTPAALQSYRAYVKKYPWKTSELYISTISDMGFDYEILDKRIMELRKMKSLGKMPYRTGNFYREGDPYEGNVYWKDEPEGKFELSIFLKPEEANLKRRTMVYDVSKGQMVPAWEPVYKSRYTCGADPFRYKSSRDISANKQSDGGIAVLWHDFSIQDKSKSRRFVASYRHRPESLDEYCEDVLRICEWLGALCYPENNLTGVIEYFIKRGRGGYLKYDTDPMTGRNKTTPGYFAGTSTINDGIAEIKDYIAFNGADENHLSFLEEVRGMRSVDDLTNNDRFAAHMASLLGARSSYGKINDLLNSQMIDLGKVPWLKKHSI